MSEKVFLMILDGWGHGRDEKANAIFNADTPFIDSLYKKYPNGELITCGEDVGLPDGQMGNSEVGHLNIGAGRVVYQDLAKLNVAIRSKTFFREKALLDSIDYCKKNNRKLHLMGLVSDGGVHSHINHLKALCTMAAEAGVNYFVHAFTDGRDTDPHNGIDYIRELQSHIVQTGFGKIATVIGRYYAMDRDKRWERVAKAYNALVNGEGEKFDSAVEAIQTSYKADVTDEFITPKIITDIQHEPLAKIEEGDAVICFNFRTDRCREITIALTQQAFPDFNMQPLSLHYTTMTNYDHSYKNVHVVYDKENLHNTLGEILSLNHKRQLRIAETEKYPHVTFFFNGGREEVFQGEERIMVQSPKVATYDLQPVMSADGVTTAVIDFMEKNKPDFICLNFANPDMVGHTGDYQAVTKAVEKIDSCAQKITEVALSLGYHLFITADHGNAEFMINEDGTPNTAHTTNKVPFFIIDKSTKKVHSGRLADIAPTILGMMKIIPPVEMTGRNLIDQ